jgi:hypothetical protein
MKKLSYLKYCWVNFYSPLFVANLAFAIGILIEVEGYNKLFSLTPILAMIALAWGSRKGYSIYLSYINKK